MNILTPISSFIQRFSAESLCFTGEHLPVLFHSLSAAVVYSLLNPFTAPACKISRLKRAHSTDTSADIISDGPIILYFQYCAFCEPDRPDITAPVDWA